MGLGVAPLGAAAEVLPGILSAAALVFGRLGWAPAPRTLAIARGMATATARNQRTQLYQFEQRMHAHQRT
ncbi:MAG: hypothetical protein BRC58_08285 [Cyanobacteria bacterium QS_8_64_29]|nr:MAG: hypothetical protein BRC58_08285 [Cyanobacteria bacterium QS_8_64_29]